VAGELEEVTLRVPFDGVDVGPAPEVDGTLLMVFGGPLAFAAACSPE